MISEFRDFLLRGNIVELAVAFVITFTINDAVFRYGAFLTAVVQFLAIAAAAFFLVVKPVKALLDRFRSPVEAGMPDEERRHQELLAR